MRQVDQVDQVATPRRLTTAEQLAAIIGRPAPMVMLKQISALDEGCRRILNRSPIAAFGYRDTDGTSTTTFIGGTPGFTHVHSPHPDLVRRSGAGRPVRPGLVSRTEQDVIFADELRRLERDHPDRLSVTRVLTSRDRRLDADGVRRWIVDLAVDPDTRRRPLTPLVTVERNGSAPVSHVEE
ncbi:hypothetical protein O7608_01255 [Solwaraspora sp. WMMA2056]|uniref:hypothetical protein n=1 Tax=Solwaraspora sp. WMMA2056 TaxID=3015161 RepID=UPI00259B97ED|nr:hypothetical protein [Solwaraspora sp. WMMA2056]WJK41118.1 hypothetical protein O7608_01255 [Solwaraspora sp. WMMA2056]